MEQQESVRYLRLSTGVTSVQGRSPSRTSNDARSMNDAKTGATHTHTSIHAPQQDVETRGVLSTAHHAGHRACEVMRKTALERVRCAVFWCSIGTR